MAREAVVAGMFYEGAEKRLKQQIEGCFKSEFGPGKLPGKAGSGRVVGAISPHAGYLYSGAGAAWVYKEIAESQMPDVFVVLGTNHTGMGSTSTLLDDWRTPLGNAKVDKEFGKTLIENSIVADNEDAHMQEHSIEVQLPFLQYVYGEKLKFVPVMVSQFIPYEKLAEGIKKAAEITKKKVCVIASSDFTHFGANYGYVPFEKHVKNSLYHLDRQAIDLICSLNVNGFHDFVERFRATICGFAPITVLMEYCKLMGVKGKLLKYYTSGDIVGDYSNAVGYGAIVFKK